MEPWNARRVVVKLGTQLLMTEGTGTLARERLAALVNACARLRINGRNVIIVTSGAVGLGRQALGLLGTKLELAEKQACAAVGQSLLMETYRALFAAHGLTTAQLLLTANDFADREHYLNLQKTMDTLLTLGTVPIVNENDSVATVELRDNARSGFGDNDKLSALVAAKLNADLLVILTNVDGIHTANPFTDPGAKRVPLIENFSQLTTIQAQGGSQHGRGGMASKLDAVRVACIAGVDVMIASGLDERVLDGIFDARSEATLPGTFVRGRPPSEDAGRMPQRKQWIGFASGYSGVVMVNDKARSALVGRHASLLAVGIVEVQGAFLARAVVSLQDARRVEFGRGLVNFNADDTRRMMGQPSTKFSEVLGVPTAFDVVMQRDNMVIFDDYEDTSGRTADLSTEVSAENEPGTKEDTP